MNIAIIASKKDEASLNIVSYLIGNQCAFKALGYEKYPLGNHFVYLFDRDSVYLENIDKTIKADLFLFISRHASRNPIPALTTHSIGNFDIAELGGETKKLVPSNPLAIIIALRLQQRAQELGWEFFQEVTHHGPYLETPTLFMEIGSTKVEWENQNAGKIVAANVMHFLELIEKPFDIKPAIGIGGLHNAIPLRRLSIENNYALGHICPKYMLEHLDKEMVQQMIDKTPGAKTIILDWKGLGSEKRRILNVLEESFKEYEIIKKK